MNQKLENIRGLFFRNPDFFFDFQGGRIYLIVLHFFKMFLTNSTLDDSFFISLPWTDISKEVAVLSLCLDQINATLKNNAFLRKILERRSSTIPAILFHFLFVSFFMQTFLKGAKQLTIFGN